MAVKLGLVSQPSLYLDLDFRSAIQNCLHGRARRQEAFEMLGINPVELSKVRQIGEPYSGADYVTHGGTQSLQVSIYLL